MKITLELNAEEIHALRPLADAAGVDLETVLHHLIAQLLLPTASSTPPALKEDMEEDMEEDAERRREQEEMQANIRRWHAEKRTEEAG